MSDKAGIESHYIVSHLELSSDSPFGSDRESGCDKIHVMCGVILLMIL